MTGEKSGLIQGNDEELEVDSQNSFGYSDAVMKITLTLDTIIPHSFLLCA